MPGSVVLHVRSRKRAGLDLFGQYHPRHDPGAEKCRHRYRKNMRSIDCHEAELGCAHSGRRSVPPLQRVGRKRWDSAGRQRPVLAERLEDSAPAGCAAVAPEELSTPGRLVTQAPAAQFSNISGRLNALRLGSFSGISRGSIANLDPTGTSPEMARGGAGDTVVGPMQGGGYPTFGGSSSASALNGGFVPAAYYYAVDDQAQNGPTTTDSASPSRAVGAASGGLGQHWGWFTQGSYDFGKRSQSTNEDPFDFHAQSVTAGV